MGPAGYGAFPVHEEHSRGQAIKVFNHGNHTRDFTYVDDIVEGVIRASDQIATPNPNWSSDAPDPATSNAPFRIFNIGNNAPVKLSDYIEAVEDVLGRKRSRSFCPFSRATCPIPMPTPARWGWRWATGLPRRSERVCGGSWSGIGITMGSGTGKRSDRLTDGFRRLYGHLSSRRRRQLLSVLGLMLVGAIAELATLGAVLPFLALISDPGKASSYPVLQELFVSLGWTEPDQILLPVTLLFAAVALGAGAVRLLLAWVTRRFVYRLGYDLSVEVYRRTLFQSYSYHVSKNTSELIAGVNKVGIVTTFTLLHLMEAVTAAIISVFILATLFAIDAKIALLAAASFGAMYLAVSYATRRRLRNNSKVVASSQTIRVRTVQEGVGGIRDVLIDQAQPVYLAKFARVDSEFRDAQALSEFLGAAPRFVFEALGMVLIAVLALVLSRQPGGLMSALPVLGALALGAQRLLPMLQLIYNGWAQIAGTRQSLFDVLDILDLPIDATSKAAKQTKTSAVQSRDFAQSRELPVQIGPAGGAEGCDAPDRQGAKGRLHRQDWQRQEHRDGPHHGTSAADRGRDQDRW